MMMSLGGGGKIGKSFETERHKIKSVGYELTTIRENVDSFR